MISKVLNSMKKSKSWKEYCNVTSEANPWNAIYKTIADKTKRATYTSTLRQQDESLSKDLHTTLTLMLQKFAPEDNQDDDNDNHRQIRNLIGEPMDTEDDVEFTEQEVTNAIQDMRKKGPRGRRDNQ